ncbi:flavodoxin family protein [Lactimicrobium massiliense]|uniref:flavodoxin family protein n=1 Tax=Lactimicrobium massiliense TaxID=2161814 RepID=UPI000D559F36|nr:flavodoxin family protein [Lactimicrobium massiliense]
MKVLMINGSPHQHGCVDRALQEVGMALKQDGVDSEIFWIGNKDIRGCIACNQCQRLGHCVFDDAVNEAAKKFEAADGLIIGTPVYYASANGTAVSFMDRLFYSTPFDKRFKVGASVVSARRAGTTATFDQMNKYFTIAEMPVVSSSYWNMVHGFTAEDVEKDLEGLQVMRVLGHNMAFMVKAIADAKQKYGLPAVEKHIFTNFID